MASLKYQTQSIQNKSSHLPITHYPPPLILPQRRVPRLTQIAKPETQILDSCSPTTFGATPSHTYTIQFSSVAQLCTTLCNPMNSSKPGLPVYHQLPEFTSIKSVIPSSHFILCRPLLLPWILPSIRDFSNESTLHIKWPKYWSFSFSTIPSKEHPGLIL